MRFLVDAQLPRRLSYFLLEKGYDSLHTLDLPDKNKTPDTEIIALAERDKRIVITKDTDFFNSFLVYNKPKKLILIRTGNLTNAQLLFLFDSQITQVIEFLRRFNLVEITQEAVIGRFDTN